MPLDLDDLRGRLDAADRALIDALAERHRLIRDVAAFKAGTERPLYDPKREDEMLERLGQHAESAGLDAYYVTSLYRRILDYSVRFQTDHLVDRQNPDRRADRIVIAYPGTPGAHAHLAALHHFSSREAALAPHGYTTLEEAAAAVEAGEADYAVLPLENTTAGSINETYDLLAASPVAIVGEEVLEERHCLVGIEPVPLRLIRRIVAHPGAAAQCSRFLAGLRDVHVETHLDTGRAIGKLCEDYDLSEAAIATEEVAARYGLQVLEHDIANEHENYTRYVVVAAEPVRYDLRIPCKTSLLFTTPHEEGALMRCLNELAGRGLNLTKLESRPVRSKPWAYRFYVDVEGNAEDPRVVEALEALGACARDLKVLGSYPARTLSAPTGPAAGPPANAPSADASPGSPSA